MKVICLVAGILLSCSLYSQDSPSLYNEVVDFPDKLFGVIEKRTNDYRVKLVNQTDRYLLKLARREKQLQRRLWKKDSTTAKQLFGNPDSTYQKLQQQLISGTPSTFRDLAYNSHLDSMQTALRFIGQQGAALPNKTAAIQSSLNSYTQLQQTLNGTEAIQKQLQQRQQYLQQQLQSIGLVKELAAFKKDVYYYKQQLNTYKEAFNDPQKLEQVLMQTVKLYKRPSRQYPQCGDGGNPKRLLHCLKL
ncbi:hypothetical protein [Niastella populi]|uniref:Uncharacterized protein n=1 Tax=Niastella populi TaxID=550983 RepID=A0A1V9FDA8_9BACT|nr:hypothetical protein [Niastella populi]OQP56166.1 hypothetical protein A4R26_27055 [Niastella populi]